MQIDSIDGDDCGPSQPVISFEEEEEVVLVWAGGKKHRSIRELSMAAREPEDKSSKEAKDDNEVLSYYRYVTD